MSNSNDFPLVEAPAAGRKGVFSIAMVLFSFTFFTGTMFAGGKLGVSFSIVHLLWIAVIGNALLALYAASLGWIAARSGLNTVLMGRFCFGEIGSKLADFILGFAELALRNPALWTLALASAFMYIDRYAVNSWGIFFLEQDKAYSTLEASGIIGVNAIAGIAGTIIAGMLSDRFFPRNRSVMAGFISLLNTAGFALMLWSPHNYYTDILAMIIFGATIGALTCFLGGLIAVDISSRKAAGAALGTIGIASYAGAGLGEFLTGIIIDKTAILENGKTLYDFSTLALFWVGTGLGSALLCFTTAAIVARRHAVERQTSFSS